MGKVPGVKLPAVCLLNRCQQEIISGGNDGGKRLAVVCGVAGKSSTSPSTPSIGSRNNTGVKLILHSTLMLLETYFICLNWQKTADSCGLASEMLAMSWVLLYSEGFRMRRELHNT